MFMRLGNPFPRMMVAMSVLWLAGTMNAAAADQPAAKPAEDLIKVVYHADFADPRRFSAMLSNVYNMVSTYQSELKEYDVRIVFLSHGIRFVTQDKLAGTPFAEDAALKQRRADLLARLAAENPGVPIDIVAHSQGGLVARSALTEEGEPTDPRLPPINALVTLGTPHLGAPVATGLTMLGNTGIGSDLITATHEALPDKVDPGGTSIRQMAEHSDFLRRLNNRPLPQGLKTTSIGAREDLIVPAGRTLLAGAHNVTVSAPTHTGDHSELPGSPQAQREVALGLAGMAPTCQSFGDAMADAAVSGLIYATESGLGGGAWLAARRVDKRLVDLPKVTVPRRYDIDPPR